MNSALSWQKQREFGGRIGFKLALMCYRFLGKPSAKLICRFCAKLFVILNRRNSNESLKLLSLTLKRKANLKDLERHYLEFAYCIKLAVDAWIDPDSDSNVDFSGLSSLKQGVDSSVQSFSDSKGIVCLSAHFGPLEQARVLSRRHPFLKLTALVYSANSSTFRSALTRLNPLHSSQIIALESVGPSTLIEIEEHLKNGGALGMLADRLTPSSPDRFIALEFLGATAHFPEGPFLLAYLLKCPVYFMLPIYHLETDRTTFVSTELKYDRALKRRQAILQLASSYVAELEKVALKYPYQLFNFFDMWPTSS